MIFIVKKIILDARLVRGNRKEKVDEPRTVWNCYVNSVCAITISILIVVRFAQGEMNFWGNTPTCANIEIRAGDSNYELQLCLATRE